MGETYQSAGVSLEAGEKAVQRIGDHVRSTFRREVVGDVGGFGGLFALDVERYRQPVLVASTDGVGTKARLADATGRFDTIGVDLVAMCVDDVACQGAEPLFFLDYIAVGHLDPDHVEALVAGVAEGCRQAGCALIGGELAEHPGAMEPGQFDLVGSAVGVVEHDRLITGSRVEPGDSMVALPSSGLRCNGYSLARRVLLDVAGLSLDEPAYAGAHHSLADELLAPSLIYAPALSRVGESVELRAIAHITGGGIAANVARVLPPGVDAVLYRQRWETPPIFEEIARLGDVSEEEMARVFNLGLGMVMVVASADVHRAIDVARAAGHRAVEVGEIIGEGSGQVVLRTEGAEG